MTLVRPPKVKDRVALPSSPKPVRVRYNQDDLVNCRSVEELHKLMNEGFMDVRVPKQKAPGTPTDSGKLKAKIASCRSIQDLRSVLKEDISPKGEEAKTKTNFVRSKIPGSVLMQQQQQQSRPNARRRFPGRRRQLPLLLLRRRRVQERRSGVRNLHSSLLMFLL